MTNALPPGRRSGAAKGLSIAAAQGRFALQVCQRCGAVQYPPRDVCGNCLSDELVWSDVLPDGELRAVTTIRVSVEAYFRQLLPWRTGIVRLDCGPSVIAHLHGKCASGDRVRLSLKTDRAGQGAMFCLPAADDADNAFDRQFQQFTCDPRSNDVAILGGKDSDRGELCQQLQAMGGRVIVMSAITPSEPDLSAIVDGGFGGVLSLIRSSADLTQAARLRGRLRPHQIRLFRIMIGSKDQPLDFCARRVWNGLETGIEDISVGEEKSEFLRQSTQFPGLWEYDEKE